MEDVIRMSTCSTASAYCRLLAPECLGYGNVPSRCHSSLSQGLRPRPGEGQKQNVDDMLAAALQYYGEAGELHNSPVPLALEREKSMQALSSPLRYPGKLAADLAGERLFVSDSNNHRWASVLQSPSFPCYPKAVPESVTWCKHGDSHILLPTVATLTSAKTGCHGHLRQAGGTRQESNSAVTLCACLTQEASCRVVICDLSGQFIDQIGGNGPALRDGSFQEAAFNRPQGLAFSARRNRLYVADTESHALREVGAYAVAGRKSIAVHLSELRLLRQDTHCETNLVCISSCQGVFTRRHLSLHSLPMLVAVLLLSACLDTGCPSSLPRHPLGSRAGSEMRGSSRKVLNHLALQVAHYMGE